MSCYQGDVGSRCADWMMGEPTGLCQKVGLHDHAIVITIHRAVTDSLGLLEPVCCLWHRSTRRVQDCAGRSCIHTGRSIRVDVARASERIPVRVECSEGCCCTGTRAINFKGAECVAFLIQAGRHTLGHTKAAGQTQRTTVK